MEDQSTTAERALTWASQTLSHVPAVLRPVILADREDLPGDVDHDDDEEDVLFGLDHVDMILARMLVALNLLRYALR